MSQRRCSERRFLLRPDRITNDIFLYALAYSAQKTGVLVHEVVVMSNHYHLVMTDVRGERPRFFQIFDSLVARATNAAFGRWESFWAPGSYCAPVLLGPDDVLAKCLYVLNNPVSAGLVPVPGRWGGVSSWELEYGVPVVAKRPKVFFSPNMPDELNFVIHRPTGLFPGVDDAEARRRLRVRTLESARSIAREFRSAGGAFVGMGRVLRQPRESSPETRAPRRGLRPRVAGRSKWARIEALQRVVHFLDGYSAALARYIGGETEVLFPRGTYLMRRRFGVALAEV